MQKILRAAANRAVEGNTWTKFTKPTVNRGKTVFPKTEADLEKFGVRWDYDGDVERSKTTYHKFQMQPNAGSVPSTIKKWREAHGGTHAVMADVFVKKDGTKEDVEKSLKAANDEVKGV